MTRFDSPPKTTISQLLTRYSRILRDSSWVAGSLGLTAVINLAGTRLITHFLSPALFGQVNLLQNLVLLLRNLFCFPTLNAATRFYSEAAREQNVRGLRGMLTRSLARAMWMMQIILLLIGVYLYWRQRVSVWVPVALGLYLLFDVCRTFEIAFFNGARRQRPAAVVAVLESAARPLLIVGAVILFSARLDVVLLAIAASVALALGFVYATAHLEGVPVRGAADPVCGPQMRRFARELIPYAFMMWITSVSDRYIIEWFSSDTAQVGIYAAGYGLISQPFIMVNSVLSLTLRPVYFAQVTHDEDRLSRRTFRVWLMLAGSLCVGGLLLAWMLRHWVVDIFLAPIYAQAAVIVPWIASGYVFYVIQQVLEQNLMAHRRAGAVLWVQGVGAAASIGATIPLVARFGMVGAAYACPIYFLIPCALTAILIYRYDSRSAEH